MWPKMLDGTTWSHNSNSIELNISGSLPPLPPKIAYNYMQILDNIEDYTSPFPDLNLTTLLGKAAAELWRRDIISGYLDGQFKSANHVNRAEAAKFLVTAKYGGPLSSDYTPPFSDVPSDVWFTKYVNTAHIHSIIDGYQDGSFGPGNTVNTAEFIKMIALTFKLPQSLPYTYWDVSDDQWFAPYAGAVQVYNLFPLRSSNNLDPGQLMTREEVAIAIYQYYKYQWDLITTAG